MINHKNEIKDDNRVENLEFCDRKYNVNYGTGIKRSVEKRINGKKSKPVNQYTKEGILIAQYPSTREVGRQGFDQSAVSACCRGKKYYKSYKGFIWKFAE